MQTLDVIQLSEALSARKGAQPITIVARTEPALVGGRKSLLYGHKVEKVSRVNGIINWSYQNAVNNQRLREETPMTPEGEVIGFISEPRKWGQRVFKTAFVTHIPKGGEEKKVYLEFKHENSLGYQYFIDGEAVEPEEVEPFLRPASESSRQQVEKQVILRDYRISNIEQLTFGKETYGLHVTPEQEAELFDKLNA